MKSIHRLPGVLALLLALASAPAQAGPVGESAPDFALTDTQGAQVALADYKGQVTLVFFFGYS